jgi:hypothetical protein
MESDRNPEFPCILSMLLHYAREFERNSSPISL